MSSSRGWRIASITATLALCSTPTLSANAQAQTATRDSIEGKWSGMAGLPTDRVAIAFEIKRDSVGKLRAYLYQQVSNFYGLELPGDFIAYRQALAAVLNAMRVDWTEFAQAVSSVGKPGDPHQLLLDVIGDFGRTWRGEPPPQHGPAPQDTAKVS